LIRYSEQETLPGEKPEKKERLRGTAGSSLDYTDRKIRGGEKSSTPSRRYPSGKILSNKSSYAKIILPPNQ
jgi:hypothetical protein